jgi:hypothetical protein
MEFRHESSTPAQQRVNELRLLLAAGEIDEEEFKRKRVDAQSTCRHAGFVAGAWFTCVRCGAEFAADLEPPVDAIPSLPH